MKLSSRKDCDVLPFTPASWILQLFSQTTTCCLMKFMGKRLPPEHFPSALLLESDCIVGPPPPPVPRQQQSRETLTTGYLLCGLRHELLPLVTPRAHRTLCSSAFFLSFYVSPNRMMLKHCRKPSLDVIALSGLAMMRWYDVFIYC